MRKEYLRRTRKLFKTKLKCRNLSKGIKTCTERYSESFLEWTREELQQIDLRTRKINDDA